MSSHIAEQYLKQYYNNTIPLINEYLREQDAMTAEFGSIPIQMMGSFENILNKGKRIRGALFQLACESCGLEITPDILRTSLLLEIFHCGILVYDDVMDNDDRRRGIKTIHTEFKEKAYQIGVRSDNQIYGISIAMLVSGISFYQSWELLNRASTTPEAIKVMSKIYFEHAYRLICGQALDITISSQPDIKEEEILKVIWTKSGEYTAQLPLLLGLAYSQNADKNKEEAVKKYSECLGWAFQIMDDTLSTFGNEEKTGKPVGNDLREGKNTLYVMQLRKSGTPEQIEFLESVLGNPNITNENIEKMRNIFKESGTYDYVINKGWDYVKEGKTYVPQITEKRELQEIYESLLTFMMERTN